MSDLDSGSVPVADAVDLPRLRRLLGTPDLAWLVARARRRMELGEPLIGTVTLTGATEAQRTTAERLLGRAPRPGSSLTVPLTGVDQVLRRSGISPAGLGPAVEALTGPIVSTREAAEREARAWDAAHAPLSAMCAQRPELVSWHAKVRATGLVRRLASGDAQAAARLVADLVTVLRELPCPGAELGVFAARTCGDAHALDDDRPLATLAISAVRALTGIAAGSSPSSAEARREAWSAVGLWKDELSSTVLTLGLPGDPTTATGRALAALREAGQPAILTLRQLVRTPPASMTDATIRVCENPAVVSAAADRLGPHCPPLICTQGQPGTAAITLLRRLTASGAELHYHGDFDWGGIRIANSLLTRVTWRPWRYTAEDYEIAADRFRTRPLTGTPAVAAWDPNLTATMTERGALIEEELLLDALLADLAG